jgi:hypothetical protein
VISRLVRAGIRYQVADVFSLTGKHLSQCPLDSFHGTVNFSCEFLALWARSGKRDYLQRVADVVIHESYHLQFSDDVLSLPSLIEKHQKANADSNECVIHDFDQQSLRVLMQPEIREASKKEDAKPCKDAPQGSNPTRTCAVGNHGWHFGTIRND